MCIFEKRCDKLNTVPSCHRIAVTIFHPENQSYHTLHHAYMYTNKKNKFRLMENQA